MENVGKIDILEASVSQILGRIIFRAGDTVWEFVTTPSGCWVSKGKSISSLVKIDICPGIEEYLPVGWSYDEFMLAWYFWAKGFDSGYHKRSIEKD